MKSCVVALLMIVIISIAGLCSGQVVSSSSTYNTRQLLSTKTAQLGDVKTSIQETRDLLRADKNMIVSRMETYSSERENVLVELTMVQKKLQYEVDILTKLCSEYDGNNCDVAKSSSPTAVSSSVKIVSNSVSTPPKVAIQAETVKDEWSDDNMVIDYRLPNGTALGTCKQYLLNDKSLLNGIYFIKPFENEGEFRVYCDMKHGGYIIFQRRLNDKVDFYREWKDYATGFGDVKNNYWLGLNTVSKFSNKFQTQLLVYVYYGADTHTYSAVYNTFKVAPETSKFQLTVSGYQAPQKYPLTDSLLEHSGYKFSTKDVDNDIASVNCSQVYDGAWWYSNCHASNLNGKYLNGKTTTYANGMAWRSLGGYYYSLERTAMGMIEV